MAALPVHVTANIWAGIETAQKKVTPSTIEISLSGKHEVEWYCVDRNQTVLVRFPTTQSPFDGNTFTVPQGGSVLSGPAKQTVNLDTPYPYDIVVNGTVLQLATQAIIIIRP